MSKGEETNAEFTSRHLTPESATSTLVLFLILTEPASKQATAQSPLPPSKFLLSIFIPLK